MGFCHYCQKSYESTTEGDIHTYEHMQTELGRDYSAKLWELRRKLELERARK